MYIIQCKNNKLNNKMYMNYTLTNMNTNNNHKIVIKQYICI